MTKLFVLLTTMSYPFLYRTSASQHGIKSDWIAGECKPSSPFKPRPGTTDAQIEGGSSSSVLTDKLSVTRFPCENPCRDLFQDLKDPAPGS